MGIAAFTQQGSPSISKQDATRFSIAWRSDIWGGWQDASGRKRVLPVTLPLIDHLALRVRDVRRSRTFYEQALEPFGVKVVESSQGPGFAIEGGGDFWIGEGEPPAAPVHVAFAAADRATVDKFHRAAVEAGGRDNGAPGLRPHYHAGYYAAFVIDPDGNNVEAVFHGDR